MTHHEDTGPSLASRIAACHSEILAQRVILAVLRLRQLATKYDPDQPRVPAGSPDGGQWTSGGATDEALQDAVYWEDDNPAPLTPAGYRSVPTPKDAVTYSTSDGTKFLAPPTANFQKVYEYGLNIRVKLPLEKIESIRKAIGQEGYFDFQRSNHTYIDDYVHASNFAVGVLMNGAGFSRFGTDASGATYWLLFSTGDIADQIKWWHYGYDAAQGRRLPRRNASSHSYFNWT